MNSQEIRQAFMGACSDIRLTAAAAWACAAKPVLFLLTLLALNLFLSTAVMARLYYRDADGDGYGNPAVFVDRNNRPPGYVTNNGDCNDANNVIHPGVPDLCDGVDNDCDASIDEGCVTWYRDSDNDLHGNPMVSMVSVTQPAGYVTDNTDCDDSNGAVFPGATEICDTVKYPALKGGAFKTIPTAEAFFPYVCGT